MTIHVLYAGADRFVAALVPKLGRIAREAFETHLGSDEALSRVMGNARVDATLLRSRVAERLAAQPIDDFRIDFEDGYGVRSDDEEDEHARLAGERLAEGDRSGTLPPHIGIRIAPLDGDTKRRALRTLKIVLEAMVAGGVRRPLRITLPKVEHTKAVSELLWALADHEKALGMETGMLSMELMLEQPAAFLDAEGRVPIRALVAAGRGRVKSCHLGSYDLTAALDVPGWAQTADHPACATARMLGKLALAGTDVTFVDGATTRLPLPVVREPKDDADRLANHEAIVGAMADHAANVRRAMSEGIHAGWDLHPAQIPARLVAVIASYLSERDAMAARLDRFLSQRARATATGTAFDDAATGRALVSFFDRGRASGAFDAVDLAEVGIDRAPPDWRR